MNSSTQIDQIDFKKRHEEVESFHKLQGVKKEHLTYLRGSILSTTTGIRAIEALKNAHAALKEQCGEEIVKRYSTNLGEPSFRLLELATLDELGISAQAKHGILNACSYKNVPLYDMDPEEKLSCLVRANERKLPSARFIPNGNRIVPDGKAIVPGKIQPLAESENLSTEKNGVAFLENIEAMLHEAEGKASCVKQVPAEVKHIGLLKGILEFTNHIVDVEFNVSSKGGTSEIYAVTGDCITMQKRNIEKGKEYTATAVFTVSKDGFPFEFEAHKFLHLPKNVIA